MDSEGSRKSDSALGDEVASSSTSSSWDRASGVAVPGFFVLPTSPPPMESLGSSMSSLLLCNTRELSSSLATDPAVLSCGSLLTAVAEVQDKTKPWGWLCPLQETDPPTQVAPLVASSVTVGRDQTCGLVLQPNIFPFYDENIQFNKISRVHFEIRRKNGVSFIMNKSMNGTFGNRTPLDKDRLYELRNTDKIAIISPALPLFAFLEERSYLRTSTLPVQVTLNYLVGPAVGAGTFSTVRKGWSRQGFRPVALKVIRKLFSDSYSDCLNELAVMLRLEHPCIARLVTHAESFQEVVIVMEFYPGGELGKLVEEEREAGRLSEQTAMFQFYQVVQAVVHLHGLNVCHRDIKPGNILLVEHSNRSLLKLADFGVSKLLSETGQMDTLVGTPYYIAPEVVRAAQRPFERYTSKADCWSLGVLLYQLLTGERPFQSRPDRGPVMAQIQTGLYDSLEGRVSGEASHLVTGLLQVNPHLRPNAAQLLHYQWFRLEPEVREAARAAHYKMWGSMDSFPILSHEEVRVELEEQEEVEALVLGVQEAGLGESLASLLLRQEQEQGPWRTEEEEEERRQAEEEREMAAMGLPVKFCSNSRKEEMMKAEAVKEVIGAGDKEVAREVDGGDPISRQKSSIKQRLRPRRHSVTDLLQNGVKRKAMEDRNDMFQALASRKRRKSEAQPAHTGRERGRRGRRRSTGVH